MSYLSICPVSHQVHSIQVKDRHFPSRVALSLWPASLLFRWKAADTVFDQLSFSCQVWRYATNVAMTILLALVPSMFSWSTTYFASEEVVSLHSCALQPRWMDFSFFFSPSFPSSTFISPFNQKYIEVFTSHTS